MTIKRVGRKVFVTAWGETKNLLEWLEDPRCKAGSRSTITYRIEKQGRTPEEAISLGPDDLRVLKLTWKGKTQKTAEWAEDPECPVDDASVIRARLSKGWSVEKALSTPVRPIVTNIEVTAWGETKSHRLWAKDPRCVISIELLRLRLLQGMDPEEAMSTPVGHIIGTVTAFGETKLAKEWANTHPRCLVTAQTIMRRIQRGYTPEKAITEAPTQHTVPVAERFERDLRAGESFTRVSLTDLTDAAEIAGGPILWTNFYPQDGHRFCIGVTAPPESMVALAAALADLAHRRPNASVLKTLAFLAKGEHTGNGGAVPVWKFPNSRLVDEDGNVWRTERGDRRAEEPQKGGTGQVPMALVRYAEKTIGGNIECGHSVRSKDGNHYLSVWSEGGTVFALAAAMVSATYTEKEFEPHRETVRAMCRSVQAAPVGSGTMFVFHGWTGTEADEARPEGGDSGAPQQGSRSRRPRAKRV